MTAFTVGHTENYDKILRDGYGPNEGFPVGSPPHKVGRTDDLNGKYYPGGAVFFNVIRAAWYIRSIGKVGVWSVYEIDADYEQDAIQDGDEPFRRLLRDALIIRKIEADSADAED